MSADIFFTSDLHFGHANISALAGRPFPHGLEGVCEMNEAMIERWNADVGKTDLVFVLGDFAMGRIAENLPLAGRLNGIKTLVAGNHDRCWVGARGPEEKALEWVGAYIAAGFAQVAHCAGSTARYEPFEDQGFKLHHFPFEGDSGDHEDRYVAHRPADDGVSWLLHGHVHQAWRQRGRQINVGVDAWGGRVVPFEVIKSLVADGPQDLAALPW